MGGSMRNKQLLRIAIIVSVVLLIAYLYFSWQSDVKNYKDKLSAANVEYQDLLTKFNKLTDELKRNVQRAAETRHELEKAQKTHQVDSTKKDDQIKRCMDELREYKSQLQSMESHRDRAQSEKEQLEQHKQTAETELSRLSNELDELKLSSARDRDSALTCNSELKDVKAQLLSAQTDSLGTSQKAQECQAKLSAATEAYETCQKKLDTLEAESYNKDAEIQQLQAQANHFKQQQQVEKKRSQPLRKSMVEPSPDEAFKDIDIVNSHREKILVSLKEKLKRGQILTEQEQQALQMLTKLDGVDLQVPTKRKLNVGQTDDAGKKDQHLPSPPLGGNPPEPNRAEEEQVVDLVNEKNKKNPLENLDMKEDNIEGGADGGDDGEDHHEHNGQEEEEDYDDRLEQERDYGNREQQNHHEGRAWEEGKPLPDPMRKNEFPDNNDLDDPEGHEALRKDQNDFRKEFYGRKREIFQGIKKGPGRNEVR